MHAFSFNIKMGGVGFGRVFQILIFLSFLFPIKTISKNNSSSKVVCIEMERDALLRFKKELQDPSNRLSSWTPEVDCCKWVGIHCDSLTGHVNELNLSNTQYVDLWETKIVSFPIEGSQLKGNLSDSILNLKHLNSIDLSHNSFQGLIPHQLGNLSNLQRLDLRGNSFYCENLHWIHSLHSLVSLDLSNTDLSEVSDWLLDINKLSFLKELHLYDCRLDYITPLSHVNFTSLFVLDISLNDFNTFLPKWISKLGNLVSLDLSSNGFQGPLPGGFSNLTSLENLNLGGNMLNSSLPKWLFSLTSISSLELFNNHFEGPIPCAIQNLSTLRYFDLWGNDYFNSTTIPSCLYSLHNLRYLNLGLLHLQGEISNDIANLTNLVSLYLQDNELVGNIPSSITSLCNLRDIYMSNNKISGPIPEHIGNLSSLENLVLYENELSGTLPKSIGLLSSLQSLLIFYNSLEGIVSEVHFAKLGNLKELDMSENNLTLSFFVGWVAPFNLDYIRLRSCNLGPKFPEWLRSQRNFIVIELSNAKISDTVPDWFWNLSTLYANLDLSLNQLSGRIPDFLHDVPTTMINLRSNKFHGNLPRISSNVTQLDLSNNSFVGNMTHFLCHSISQNNNQLDFLNLEDNLLSGNIPDCWTNWMLLKVVKLSSNNLSGKLPSSMGSLINLQSLHLRNNNLFGKIPFSLKNCSNLITLDLGLNTFHGNIPTWIGTSLSNLVFLGLRSNKLSGLIPHELCHLSSLQIMDIGSNNFIGPIPHCFGNFAAMATKHRSYAFISLNSFFSGLFAHYEFLDNAFVITKGQEFQYDKILSLLTSMDLSNNNLSGEIPQEITNLVELKSLNLSVNKLKGSIPQQIGSMTNMESLDLSRNELSGQIPQSISKLTFLNYLNLSYNHLLGPIPTSTQLQSFNPSSFIGNELCGLPLPNSCSTDKTTSNTDNEEAKEEDENFIDHWFYLSIAIGFVVGFWGIWGPLLISRTWRHTYFRHVSSLWHKFN